VKNPRQLLIATTNPGKVREIRRALDGLDLELLTLADLPPIPAPAETGSTFAANAGIKALAYAAASRMPTVAEDSGLVIDCLGGRPGVESARYPGATYAEKFQNLYAELEQHARPWRARFVCSLRLVDHDRALIGSGGFSCEATVEGEIAAAPRGENGFGYDPIFFYPPFGSTLGEATDDRKLAVSHRGAAFRQLRAYLSGSDA
jgi:XTP/dITP diphosphohydrolase